MHSVLNRPMIALHEGVVVGVADRPDRGPAAFEFEVLGEPDRGVLRPGVGVTDQLAGHDRVAFAAALPGRHPQRGHAPGRCLCSVAACQATIFWANTSTMNAT